MNRRAFLALIGATLLPSVYSVKEMSAPQLRAWLKTVHPTHVRFSAYKRGLIARGFKPSNLRGLTYREMAKLYSAT